MHQRFFMQIEGVRTEKMIFTCVTFVFFTILVAVISYVKTKGDDQTTADGYFLAGRGLPGIVIAGSLLLTNLSAEQLVGTNGQTWAIGMSPMAFEVMAATALIVLALFAAPRYLKSGITTIPQLLGERYDRPTKLWFSIAYIILYLFVQIPVILYSGSLVFENIFNLSGILGITKFQSIVILCILITIIGSIYAIFGGLKAVAVSDTINGVGLLIGGLMIPFLALNVLGHASGSESSVAIMDGVRYLIHNHADMLNSIAPAQSEAPAVPWPTVFLGLVFLGFQSWCTHQSFIQRVLAAENLKEAQKGALYCAFLKILGFMFLALPGVIAYAIFNIEGTQVSMMDDAYPALITRVVPQPIMGFFAAVMFGAILSSFNSVLNSASTMFTLDLYRTAINPKASDMQCVKVGKIYGTCAGAVAICVAPFVMFAQGITTFLNSMSQFVSLPILFTVLGALIFRKAPKYAPKVITAVHVIAYGAFMIIKPCYPTSGEPIHYLYAIAVLFVVEFAIMWYLNKYRGTEEYVPADVDAVDLTPWKYRHIVCIIGIILAIGIYILFSPIGIAA